MNSQQQGAILILSLIIAIVLSAVLGITLLFYMIFYPCNYNIIIAFFICVTILFCSYYYLHKIRKIIYDAIRITA